MGVQHEQEEGARAALERQAELLVTGEVGVHLDLVDTAALVGAHRFGVAKVPHVAALHHQGLKW